MARDLDLNDQGPKRQNTRHSELSYLTWYTNGVYIGAEARALKQTWGNGPELARLWTWPSWPRASS